MGQLKDIVVDCREPWPLAHWWAATLGYQVRPHTADDLEQLRADGIERPEDDPNIAVDPIDEKGPSVWFCKVPEPKVAKNRVHIDVYGDVDTPIERGAVHVETHPKWTVLTDPEGNEFCVFAVDTTT